MSYISRSLPWTTATVVVIGSKGDGGAAGDAGDSPYAVAEGAAYGNVLVALAE